jgi:uncharacterized protein (TIGR03437 family)
LDGICGPPHPLISSSAHLLFALFARASFKSPRRALISKQIMIRATLWCGGMLMLATAGPAAAQVAGAAPFTQLAATDDGENVFFTSQLVLKSKIGQAAAPEGRLYRLGPDGVSLLAERGSLAAYSWLDGTVGVTNPQVSGDGSTVGFTFRYVCTAANTGAAGYGFCAPGTGKPSDEEGVLSGMPNVDLGPGWLQLSRNGRWALLTPPVDFTPQTATLIDLTTGQRTSVPVGPVENSYPTLASDGTILVEERGDQGVGTNRFGLWKDGQTTPVELGDRRAQILSDNAQVLLLGDDRITQPFLAVTRLTAMDLLTGRQTALFLSKDDRELAIFMGISNDGGTVLYRRVPEYGPFQGPAYVADTASGESRPIALPAGELVSDGTLSGSGDLAFLATTAGRLIKVTWSSGETTTLIPATPYGSNLDHGFVPGSLFHLRGALIGSPDDWSGGLTIDDHPVPVVYARLGDVGIQVPWEQHTGYVPFRLSMPSDSPFQQIQTVLIKQIAPDFEPLDPGQASFFTIKIFRADWSGLLDSAPGPGDIVHMYMTGLGTVDGTPQTGVAASLTTSNPIQGKIACGFNSISDLFATDAETLFAGLAPGTIGVYLVSLRLPADQGSKPLEAITCDLKAQDGFESLVIGGLGQP